VDLTDSHEGIWAVVQTGSPARGDRVDAFSDLDIELIGPAAPDLSGHDDWLAPLGPRLVALHLANEKPGEPDWPTCLVVLALDRKIDFTLAGPSRATELVENGLDDLYRRGYQVLLDKTGITADLPRCPFTAPDVKHPRADEFDAHQAALGSA
jgi:aminoglycoside 6-adenylyltransferase